MGITPGPDGAVWFTENAAAKIGRITTAGDITEIALPRQDSAPYGITANANDLWFTENAFGEGNVIRLTPPGKPVTPYFRFIPMGVDFAAMAPGLTSAPQTATITSEGNTSSGKITVKMDDTLQDNASFVLGTDTCNGASLQAGQSCTIDVSFVSTVTSTSVFAGGIIITPEFGDPGYVYLSGASFPCTLSATYWLDFGAQPLGATTPGQTASVTNTGNVSCGVVAVALGNTNPTCAHFAISQNTCGSVALDAGKTCTFDVSFMASCTSATQYVASAVMTPESGDPTTTELYGSCPQ